MRKLLVLLFILAVEQGFAQQTPFTGTWTGDAVTDDRSITYKITFRGKGGCTVKASAIINDREVEQEAAGSYSYTGGRLKLNASFKQSRIPGLGRLQWVSTVALGEDGNSFNIIVEPDSVSRELVRISFMREEAEEKPVIVYSKEAVVKAFESLVSGVPEKSRIAVLNIADADLDEGLFFIDELTLAFVNARRFTVVERLDVQAILSEQDFQQSGYVSDDSAVSIGKFLGAGVVITGSVNGTGRQRRLVLKALDVLTAEILAMAAVGV
jgi:hypothetical protein